MHILDFHGFPWISMDFHGFPWISMDIQEICTPMGNPKYFDPQEIQIIMGNCMHLVKCAHRFYTSYKSITVEF